MIQGWKMSVLTGMLLTGGCVAAPEDASLANEPASSSTEQLTAATSYKIVSVSSGLVVDVSGVSKIDGAQVWLWTYLGQPNQQWNLQLQTDGSYGLVNVNSGKGLDIKNGSTTNGTLLQQWDWWGGPMQRWWLKQQADGSYHIVNVNSNLCLDGYLGVNTNGAGLQQWACGTGLNQSWQLQAVTGTASNGGAGGTTTTGSTGSGGSTGVGLHASGNKLVDASGQAVRLHGVNVPSLEWGDGEPTQYSSPAPCFSGQSILDSVKKAMNDWHVNFIRLPISQDRWWGASGNNAASYRATVDAVVAYVTSHGGYIDVDLHWSDMGVWGQNSSQHFMPDDNTAAALKDVAAHFSGNSSVLLGIYNEPHDVSWSVWRDGGTVNENGKSYHTPGIQALVQTVRSAAPNNVLIVGGLDWAFDLTGINNGYAISDNNLMYDAHVYPWKSTSDNWDSHITVVSSNYPVLIGEWGADNSQLGPFASPQTFLQSIHGWLTQHNYNYSAWNMHPLSTPAMITDWCYNTTSYFGAVAVPWLDN